MSVPNSKFILSSNFLGETKTVTDAFGKNHQRTNPITKMVTKVIPPMINGLLFVAKFTVGFLNLNTGSFGNFKLNFFLISPPPLPTTNPKSSGLLKVDFSVFSTTSLFFKLSICKPILIPVTSSISDPPAKQTAKILLSGSIISNFGVCKNPDSPIFPHSKDSNADFISSNSGSF